MFDCVRSGAVERYVLVLLCTPIGHLAASTLDL
jgi:hypothetical protein